MKAEYVEEGEGTIDKSGTYGFWREKVLDY
jgi:hypothetical protein